MVWRERWWKRRRHRLVIDDVHLLDIVVVVQFCVDVIGRDQRHEHVEHVRLPVVLVERVFAVVEDGRLANAPVRTVANGRTKIDIVDDVPAVLVRSFASGLDL